MSELIEIEPEYVYVTIPAEYICVYHRILAMLADYGEDMLKDCKASCTDRNSGVIECFNMFNAAVAARKLGKTKLAETLIKYIKEKINMIYQGKDNSTSFIFPIDENGRLKAFVSCGDRLKFEINPDDGVLYAHKFGDGFHEHFKLGTEDDSSDDSGESVNNDGLQIQFTPSYELAPGTLNKYNPCGELIITYNGEELTQEEYNKCSIDYAFDNIPINAWNEVTLTLRDTPNPHNFKVAVLYNNEVKVANEYLELTNDD